MQSEQAGRCGAGALLALPRALRAWQVKVPHPRGGSGGGWADNSGQAPESLSPSHCTAQPEWQERFYSTTAPTTAYNQDAWDRSHPDQRMALGRRWAPRVDGRGQSS